MIHKKLLAAVVLCWTALPLAAQTASKVELRLLAFKSDLQQVDCYAHDPAAPPTAASVKMPVKTYLNHEFGTVLLTSRKVVFTTKSDRGSLTREGETLLETTLPDGVNSAILLVVPGRPGDKAKCRALVVNDSKKAFPAGSYHATNMSALPIRLTLEQKNYDFNPAQVILIEDPPTHEGGVSTMKTFAMKDNQLKLVSTGMWPRPVKTRGVLVFFQDPTSGNVQLRAFDDIEPRDPAAPATAAAP